MLLQKIFGLRRGLPLEEVFIYNCPVWGNNSFFQRDSLCLELINCIKEPGTQVLVFGERQVGKTSLVMHCLARMNKHFIRVPCRGDMNEHDLIREILHRIAQPPTQQIGLKQTTSKEVKASSDIRIAKLEGCATVVSSREEKSKSWKETPSLIDMVEAITNFNIVILFDDIEGARDCRVIEYMGDLAKCVSNGSASSAIGKIVFSIAASRLNEIPDCLKQSNNRIRSIRVPRMTEQELKGLIKHGMILASLKLTESIIDEIVSLSEGMPARAQLFCLEAGRAVAKSAGIEDRRLSGDEREMDLYWFQNDILPNLRERGLI